MESCARREQVANCKLAAPLLLYVVHGAQCNGWLSACAAIAPPTCCARLGTLQEGGLPWKEPGKGLELPSLDFKGLGSLNLAATIDTLTEDFQVGN